MPDAIPCPHLPSTGTVYRVQLLRVVTTRDAPVQRYTICAACYARLQAVLPAEPPAPHEQPATRGDSRAWHITETAARCFARLQHDVRGRRAPRLEDIGEQEWLDAQAALERLAPTATYRERDRQGRTLWRSPPSAYGLRWIVGPAGVDELPPVIWVGAGRPPERIWEP